MECVLYSLIPMYKIIIYAVIPKITFKFYLRGGKIYGTFLYSQVLIPIFCMHGGSGDWGLEGKMVCTRTVLHNVENLWFNFIATKLTLSIYICNLAYYCRKENAMT